MTPKPGDRATRTRTIRARDIELFTELTGDRNPLPGPGGVFLHADWWTEPM